MTMRNIDAETEERDIQETLVNREWLPLGAMNGVRVIAEYREGVSAGSNYINLTYNDWESREVATYLREKCHVSDPDLEQKIECKKQTLNDSTHMGDMRFLARDTGCKSGWFNRASDRAYLVRYTSSRVYLGPQEGGTWGTHRMPRAVMVFRDYQTAEKVKKYLKEINKTHFEPDWKALGHDETVNTTYPEGFIPSMWVGSKETQYFVEPVIGMNSIDSSNWHYE
jgi:hypothetical protein